MIDPICPRDDVLVEIDIWEQMVVEPFGMIPAVFDVFKKALL
jgi:hypothetical protein